MGSFGYDRPLGRPRRPNPTKIGSEMSKCGQDDALLEPKSENVEKVLVLKAFLKGSKGGRAFQECKEATIRPKIITNTGSI